MKFKLAIFVCLFLSVGCQVNTYTETVPLDGHLTTPDGQFEFEQLSSNDDRKKFRISSSFKPFSTITAGNSSSRIVFTPFLHLSTVKFIADNDSSTLEFDASSAFYQINSGAKKSLNIPKINKPIKMGSYLYRENSTSFYYFGLNIPKISQYTSSDKIRYYLPYKIDGALHLIDIQVKIRKNRELEFGLREIPGMP